jgi:hypothetical protein
VCVFDKLYEHISIRNTHIQQDARSAVHLLDRRRSFEDSGQQTISSYYNPPPWYLCAENLHTSGVMRLTIHAPHPYRLFNSMRRKMRSFNNMLLYGLSPASPIACWSVILIVMYAVITSDAQSMWRRNVYSQILLFAEDSLAFEWWKQFVPYDLRVLYLSLIGSVLALFVLMAAQRFVLNMLLSRSSKYLFLLPSERSTLFYLWAGLVKILKGNSERRLMYSYQNTLPCLPVPSLRRTCEYFLASMKDFVQDEDKLKDAVLRFRDDEGVAMQNFLRMRSWWCDNYVTSWWEDYVYMCSRKSLLVNSNYYVCGSFWGMCDVFRDVFFLSLSHTSTHIHTHDS